MTHHHPRLIATDLDGTLLRRGGTVSPRTVRALRTAVEAGAEVVIVTARPPRYIDAVAAATGVVGTAVCSNGAQLYDITPRSVISSRTLALTTARRLAAVLAESAPGLGFAVETGHQIRYEPAYQLRHGEHLSAESPVASLADLWLLDVPIVKLLAHSTRFAAEELVAMAEQAAGGEAQFTHSGGRGLLEVSAPGVTKADAIAALCAERGISPSEVVAFGDMPNDLSFLSWAGLGYAMGNAHPDVLAAVPRRTSSNEEDGVAAVLERLFH
ncbi:Cof-type HAD-IIB family hydrolase [Streptomyces sp. SCSIO 30461]|uniref:HAD family hydrolase n=1 Tax=Streptomyces sp. SCSIO 30461 TaxID=3118085 RepID=UPI0030D29C4B